MVQLLKPGQRGPSPLKEAFSAFWPVIWATAFFSIFCNTLLFVGPLYMLQVYDRVLSSRNVGTLIALTVIAAAMLGLYSLIDVFRSRMLVRAGVKFDERLSAPLYRAMLNSALIQRGGGAAQVLRDMDTVREFWTGQAVLTLCDVPYAPVFVFFCFVIHPYVGLVALGGAVVIFSLALANELMTRSSLTEAGKVAIDASNYATASLHNIEAIHALGMQSAIHDRWEQRHKDVLGWQAQASDRAAAILTTSKFVRQFLQTLILGVGAYLSIQREISPGMMIACSIMMGRALQPVEQAVGQWKQLMGARNSWRRLSILFENLPAEVQRTALPRPKGVITAENVVAPAPGRQIPILKNVNFSLDAGKTLAVIGPSAAGKSTLARALVGVWPVASGAVRLDGSDVRHWDRERLGRYIGYLPQDVELFSGTIAENIARFQEAKDEDIIAAAELAGVHSIIQTLPDGYETQIGDGGAVLSGGQRQRVGLARAIFGDPSIIVLDEPNAHLDTQGEESLIEALKRIKERGTTIVLVTHRPQLLQAADMVMVMTEGNVKMFGPRDQVLAQLSANRQQQQSQQPGAAAQGAASTGPIPLRRAPSPSAMADAISAGERATVQPMTGAAGFSTRLATPAATAEEIREPETVRDPAAGRPS